MIDPKKSPNQSPHKTVPIPGIKKNAEKCRPRHQNCQYYAVDQALVAHRSTALYGSPTDLRSTAAGPLWGGSLRARSVHRLSGWKTLRAKGPKTPTRRDHWTLRNWGFEFRLYLQDCWILNVQVITAFPIPLPKLCRFHKFGEAPKSRYLAKEKTSDRVWVCILAFKQDPPLVPTPTGYLSQGTPCRATAHHWNGWPAAKMLAENIKFVPFSLEMFGGV